MPVDVGDEVAVVVSEDVADEVALVVGVVTGVVVTVVSMHASHITGQISRTYVDLMPASAVHIFGRKRSPPQAAGSGFPLQIPTLYVVVAVVVCDVEVVGVVVCVNVGVVVADDVPLLVAVVVCDVDRVLVALLVTVVVGDVVGEVVGVVKHGNSSS